MNHASYMRRALNLILADKTEVPVGALIVDTTGNIIAEGVNSTLNSLDIAGHAEINAIRVAMQQMGGRHLGDYILYTTLEPCPMCAFAIREARISKLVFGAFDLKQGSAGSRFDILRDGNLGPFVEVIGGVLEAECSQVIRDFFAELRKKCIPPNEP